MKMIFLALGALIILGGGGAGAYFFFMQPAEASATDEVKEEAHAKKDKHDETAHNEYVELDPLMLPIVDAGGISQTISLVIVLEVGSSEDADKVRNVEPRLKDAYIQDMYGVLNKHAALKNGVLQVGMLKSRLNKISTKVLGDDVVSDVLLQVVQQRGV